MLPTLAPAPSFLAGVFFVTPTGFAPLTLAAVGSWVVVVVVLGFVARLMAGAVSTVSKTRGLELPVAERVPSRAIVLIVVLIWV